MKHVMIDLETMGTRPDAAIVAIGAVEFDLSTHQCVGSFYHAVDLATSVDKGGTMDAATVIWWLKQSEAARGDFVGGNLPGILFVLHEFRVWLDSVRDADPAGKLEIWANGADFDFPILRSAYARDDREAPWFFWEQRDYRTLKALYPDVPKPARGVAHNALDDARNQAIHLMAILKEMQR